MTREEFIMVVVCEPEQDDLERANCPLEGLPGHWQCGICSACKRPRIYCSCAREGWVPPPPPETVRALSGPIEGGELGVARYGKSHDVLTISFVLQDDESIEDTYVRKHIPCVEALTIVETLKTLGRSVFVEDLEDLGLERVRWEEWT